MVGICGNAKLNDGLEQVNGSFYWIPKKKKKTMIEATIVQRGCNYVYSLWEGFVICPYMGIMIIDFSTCNGNLYCSNAW